MSGEESYHEKERGCTHWLQRCNDPPSSHLAVSLYWTRASSTKRNVFTILGFPLAGIPGAPLGTLLLFGACKSMLLLLPKMCLLRLSFRLRVPGSYLISQRSCVDVSWPWRSAKRCYRAWRDRFRRGRQRMRLEDPWRCKRRCACALSLFGWGREDQ